MHFKADTRSGRALFKRLLCSRPHWGALEKKMKKKILLTVAVIMLSSCALFAQKKGSGKRISFNRVSIEIPKNWYFSSNPMAKEGTDQLQLFSQDRNRTLLITLTDARDDVDWVNINHLGHLQMLSRAASIPEYSECVIQSIDLNLDDWGLSKDAIYTMDGFFKDDNEEKPLMKVFYYGAYTEKGKGVFFVSAFIIGEDNDDIQKIVKSIKVLKE